jgi:hypothetical protein
MILGVGQAIELAAILEAHWDALPARQLHDLFGARVLAAFGDEDTVERATRFERLAHRVYSS